MGERSVRFISECHVFDSQTYNGSEFFTITSKEIYGDDGNVIGFHYAIHITRTDQETNTYREYLSEFHPKVVKYTREKSINKVEWTIPKEDI